MKVAHLVYVLGITSIAQSDPQVDFSSIVSVVISAAGSGATDFSSISSELASFISSIESEVSTATGSGSIITPLWNWIDYFEWAGYCFIYWERTFNGICNNNSVEHPYNHNCYKNWGVSGCYKYISWCYADCSGWSCAIRSGCLRATRYSCCFVKLSGICWFLMMVRGKKNLRN